MPHYREVAVEITDKHKEVLTEYGVTKHDRTKLCSCFIQSETDKQFRIRIQPDESILRYDDPNYAEGEIDDFGEVQPKRWHLLATLRLDGRKKFEKRVAVILDLNEEAVEEADGEAFLKGTIVRDEDGVWREYGWVFKDVGVDVTFENLKLDGKNGEAVSAQPEDDLAEAFGAMSPTNEDQAEERSTVGQIEIRVDKVTLRERTVAYTPDPEKDHGMTQLRGSEIGANLHTVGRSAGTIKKAAPRHTHYFTYVEKNYAVFRFKYCDEKKLRKLGFLNPLPTTKGNCAEALKLAAALQKKKPAGDPDAYKFRSLDAGEKDEGSEEDDKVSEEEEDSEDEAGGPGQSQDLPLPALGEELSALGLNRTRKREEEAEKEGEEDGEKKLRAE